MDSPVLTSLLLLLGFCTTLASGQTKTAASVWDGIYSDAQAARGETGYQANCASCHRANLAGHVPNPSLAGSHFLSKWNGQSVGDLFEKIQVTMPADHPGKLSAPENAAILAYILKYNKFPAGSKDLPEKADDLRGVKFEPEKK